MTRIDWTVWKDFCTSPTEDHFIPFYAQSKGLVRTLCWRILAG